MRVSLEYRPNPTGKLDRSRDRKEPSVHFERLSDSAPKNVRTRELLNITEN